MTNLDKIMTLLQSNDPANIQLGWQLWHSQLPQHPFTAESAAQDLIFFANLHDAISGSARCNRYQSKDNLQLRFGVQQLAQQPDRWMTLLQLINTDMPALWQFLHWSPASYPAPAVEWLWLSFDNGTASPDIQAHTGDTLMTMYKKVGWGLDFMLGFMCLNQREFSVFTHLEEWKHPEDAYDDNYIDQFDPLDSSCLPFIAHCFIQYQQQQQESYMPILAWSAEHAPQDMDGYPVYPYGYLLAVRWLS